MLHRLRSRQGKRFAREQYAQACPRRQSVFMRAASQRKVAEAEKLTSRVEFHSEVPGFGCGSFVGDCSQLLRQQANSSRSCHSCVQLAALLLDWRKNFARIREFARAGDDHVGRNGDGSNRSGRTPDRTHFRCKAACPIHAGRHRRTCADTTAPCRRWFRLLRLPTKCGHRRDQELCSGSESEF